MLTPDEIDNFFENMPEDELKEIATDAIVSLSGASTRDGAEEAVCTTAPFFLDCTFLRLDPALQQRLRDAFDNAETSFGSLASVLGLDEIEEPQHSENHIG